MREGSRKRRPEGATLLTNGFALYRGEGAAEAARRGAARVARFSRSVLVDTGEGFEDVEGSRHSAGRRAELAYYLGGPSGSPLVHGFVEEGWKGGARAAAGRGEFSVLAGPWDRTLGARDGLGTRALWRVTEGRLAGSMASDHRLLEGRVDLVPPGCLSDGYEVVGGRRGERASVGKPPSFGESARTLAAMVDESVARRVGGRRRVAVSFSGGLDSSLLALAASRHAEVVLCSAFVRGSLDEEKTSAAAAALGLDLSAELLEEETVRKQIRAAVLPPGEATTMDVSLWCIYSSASRLARSSGAEMILLGQLADELFGGYRKYAVTASRDGEAAAEAMMAEDVKGCGERGFLRDEAACSRWAEVRFPYAEGRIAEFARVLPFGYKVRGGERKAVLRSAALELGLPEVLANAPKKAAQFSSGASKLVKKMTGF